MLEAGVGQPMLTLDEAAYALSHALEQARQIEEQLAGLALFAYRNGLITISCSAPSDVPNPPADAPHFTDVEARDDHDDQA